MMRKYYMTNSSLKLVFLFFVVTINVSAQSLRCVPDVNLRKALSKIDPRFIRNDSLDIEKIQGRLQLEMSDNGIEDLEGLQYFKNVWRLILYKNKIKLLHFLPPNLTDLECSNNSIERIDSLPVGLKHLRCKNNKISSIQNLPSNLLSLDFSNNSMKRIPQLPKSLQYINYSGNPITTRRLPKLFQRISCDDPAQNCMPYELMDWRILNVKIKDTSLAITGMTIKINSRYSWGFGRQSETINFAIHESNLVANQIEVNREFDKYRKPIQSDSIYLLNIDCSIEINNLRQILKNMYANEMSIQIQVGDTLKTINLKDKKNGETCLSSCSDCTVYSIQFIIFCKADTITLSYRFDSFLDNGLIICSTNGPENLKSFLNWLYVYKITNLALEKHPITINFFNRNNLDQFMKWAN